MTSGMTGFTLPGMIDEPFCRAGRLISPKPVRGPDDIRRRSLAIFESVTAHVLTAPDTATNGSGFCVESMRSPACVSSMPDTSLSTGTMRRRYVSSALMPVPMAVPPILSERISSMALPMRTVSRRTASA